MEGPAVLPAYGVIPVRHTPRPPGLSRAGLSEKEDPRHRNEGKEQKAADVAMTKEQKAEKTKAEKKKKDARKQQAVQYHREKVDMVKQSLDNHAQLQLVQLAIDSANAALHDETTISQRFATIFLR